jgi:hypothetical protein
MGAPDVLAAKPDPLSQFEVFPFFPLDDPFAAKTNASSVKLQNALTAAITAVASAHGQVLKDPRTDTDANVFPIPFTIADLSSGAPPFPSASYNGDEIDFIASEAKVAAMYAAFELRDLVRRFAKKPGVTPDNLFKKLKKYVDPQIIADGPLLKKGENISGKLVAITDVHRKPRYSEVFFQNPDGTVAFSEPYNEALEAMIIESSDLKAATVIHGIGYSFLNGILEARGFAGDAFNPNQGMWLAADYVGTYPKVRGVISVNDGPAGIAGTTAKIARMVAMIDAKLLSTIDQEDEMAVDLLQLAAALPAATSARVLRPLRPWASVGTSNNPPLDTNAIPWVLFKLNKLGFAPLGHTEKGPPVFSEVSVIDQVPLANGVTSKRFVVAWQNLKAGSPYMVVNADKTKIVSSVIPQIIRTTIQAYQT